MIHEKLRSIRKQKGISQEKMAKILSTDTSNYSRKERGETKIYNDEWEKIAQALEVPVEELRESSKNLIKNDNTTFNDNSGNYNQYYSYPNHLDDYITLLKEQNQLLKEENSRLKNDLEIAKGNNK
ncbi:MULTISPECIES: helix-turn-helix domain-containing protein [Chryseobacterium]|uniref:Helix-turn-helix domain n=1 Tax=Chryseobacterium taihuense TaxID=1141221 RepID=A0A4U8WFQ5_9FLAO|nr:MULTISPECIES: helix-turn-helix transcriptional regulator [Chryseobacterium]QQV02197.1 helix-turn-helix transcriptional regulator [Chryseobacterium sp. FDAARGOS 1104]VFB04566.1 Helix-turn-helix domain [Chryseobacterium taihuense]